jgi:hypothetical protein
VAVGDEWAGGDGWEGDVDWEGGRNGEIRLWRSPRIYGYSQGNNE